MTHDEPPKSWPDLAINLYDRLNERNAEIIYDFDNFELSVPSVANETAQLAPWMFNGKLRITTKNGTAQ